MDRLQLQKLRELPIEGVAERLGLRVKGHKALCPFHDDHHASLSFSVSRNTWRCFVCGARGGTIDLVMRHLSLGFREACRWLADEHNVILTDHQPAPPKPPKPFDASRYEPHFEHPWLSDEARHFLFEERRIDPRVAAWCRLTSWRDRQGTPWLEIPYYDREGRLVGIQNRNLTPGAQPRFRFPAGSSTGIYNLPVLRLLQPGDELWITEGCSDCWAMLSSVRKAIAIPSATMLTPQQAELLSSVCPAPAEGRKDSQQSITPHMFPDRDTPGERLFLQLKERLPGLVRHQLPPGCKDFSDYYLMSTKKGTCSDHP